MSARREQLCARGSALKLQSLQIQVGGESPGTGSNLTFTGARTVFKAQSELHGVIKPLMMMMMMEALSGSAGPAGAFRSY